MRKDIPCSGFLRLVIQGFNNRGCVNLPEDRTEIDEKDCDDVVINGRDVSIPQQDVILHSILQGYRVDGQGGVQNPLGMFARKFPSTRAGTTWVAIFETQLVRTPGFANAIPVKHKCDFLVFQKNRIDRIGALG